MTATTDQTTPRPTRLAEVRPLALIALVSTSEPNLAGLIGCSRFTAYNDARAGRWPTVSSAGESWSRFRRSGAL